MYYLKCILLFYKKLCLMNYPECVASLAGKHSYLPFRKLLALYFPKTTVFLSTAKNSGTASPIPYITLKINIWNIWVNLIQVYW